MELYLTHPYASPLFGDFTGLPPLLIQAGESEVLRDEITLLAHKATLAGVQVMHELYEDAVSSGTRRTYHLPHVINVRLCLQIHVFQAFPFLEASQHAFTSCRAFVRHGFAFAQPQDPHPLDDHTEAGLASEIDNERAHMVRGDGQDKTPSDVETPIDSEQDSSSSSIDDDDSGGGVTEVESDDSFVSVDDSLAIQAEMDGSRSTPVLRLHDPRSPSDSDDESDDDHTGLSDSRASSPSYLRSIHAQSYHGLENAQRVSSRVKTSRSPSVRSYANTLNSRHLRMSTLSVSPVPSPSIRSSSSHPDISSLCEQWESTGPANITLTYKPGGTSFSASSSKSKNHKRSPTFHHA